MRFVNDRCPTCGGRVSGITEAARVYRGLTRDTSGDYDYDGRYLELVQNEEPYLLANGRVLVECEEGHQWETAMAHDAKEPVSAHGHLR
jgi:hypothetical protein